jgi:hypothetical protein
VSKVIIYGCIDARKDVQVIISESQIEIERYERTR